MRVEDRSRWLSDTVMMQWYRPPLPGFMTSHFVLAADCACSNPCTCRLNVAGVCAAIFVPTSWRAAKSMKWWAMMIYFWGGGKPMAHAMAHSTLTSSVTPAVCSRRQVTVLGSMAIARVSGVII